MADFNHGTAAELALANGKQYYIEFYHVPTKNNVKFKAYITSFQDKFASEWNSEDVYGRMDPIVAFKGTKRNISLEWECPASSVEEAKENLQRCSLLFNMLYPVYSEAAPGAVLSSPPLFRVRFANLIHDGTKPTGAAGGVDTAANSGVVCNIDGFQYSPELEDGWFEPQHTKGIVYPQSIKLSCEMTVLHTHSLGWVEGKNNLRDDTGAFPWGEPASTGVAPVGSTAGYDGVPAPRGTNNDQTSSTTNPQAATPQQGDALGGGMTGLPDFGDF